MKTEAASGFPRKPFNPAPVWISAVAAAVWLTTVHLDLSFTQLLYSCHDLAEYFGRYTAPDFTHWSRYLALLGQTLAIAFWGTMLALAGGVLLAPLAARNMTPNRAVYRIARETLNAMRALPDLLLALVFVASLGLGPLPGVLALGLHTTGFLGKFFAECLERVDRGVIEAVQATGASRTQVLMYAGWPSIRREFLGYSLYIGERNVRMAAVLGLVGAGGIGLALDTSLQTFHFSESAALIIVILAPVLAFDNLSTWLREKLT
jgi:phosphonate transport system permease protein